MNKNIGWVFFTIGVFLIGLAVHDAYTLFQNFEVNAAIPINTATVWCTIMGLFFLISGWFSIGYTKKYKK